MRMTGEEIQLITYNTNGLIQGNVYKRISISKSNKVLFFDCTVCVFHDHILSDVLRSHAINNCIVNTLQATFYNIQYECKFSSSSSSTNLGQVINCDLWGENLSHTVNLMENIVNTLGALFNLSMLKCFQNNCFDDN